MGDPLFEGVQEPIAGNRTGTSNSSLDARERQVARLLRGNDLRGFSGVVELESR